MPSGTDATTTAARLSPPYAVKIVSRDIPHKTEAGGVQLGVAQAALGDAIRSVISNALKAKPDAKIDGVLVSEMAHGIEVLIGVINDESSVRPSPWPSVAC